MAFGRETDNELIKPLNGAIVRRFDAGATIDAGELVSMMADGNVDPTDTATFAGAIVMGVALDDAASGQKVDVVTYGPVVCLEDATPGDIIYASDTDGEPAESAGTKSAIAGIAESATVLFVRPQLVDLS